MNSEKYIMKATIIVTVQIFFISFLLLLAATLFSNRYINFGKLDSFPIPQNPPGCEFVTCTMYNTEGAELWAIEVKKESYSEFMRVIGKDWNTDLITINNK